MTEQNEIGISLEEIFKPGITGLKGPLPSSKSSILQRSQENLIPLHAEEIRQFAYCNRIIYWRRVANISGSISFLMEKGIDYHNQREQYRYNKKNDLIVHRNRYFFDEQLQLGAKIDLCRETTSGLVIVEFKRFFHGSRPFQSHILQAIFGGLVAERILQNKFSRIEIQYYPGRTDKVQVTDHMRNKVFELIKQARNMINLQLLPAPTKIVKKCKVCEFQKICQRK